MLDRTLATDFSPGINLKHDLAGASWTYLLPSLELEHIVCFGAPSPASLTTLSRISCQVTIICQKLQTTQEMQNDVQWNDPQKVSVILNDDQVLPLVEDSADLVLIVDRTNLHRLTRNPRCQDELKRILSERGLIYFELGPATHHLDRRALRTLGQRLGSPELLWLTPWHGGMQTAVPVWDTAMIDRFLQHKYYSPSVSPSSLKRMLGWRKSGNKSQGRKGHTKREARGVLAQVRSKSRPWLRAIGVKTIHALARLERALITHSSSARRYGAFVDSGANDGHPHMNKPPRYLRSIAQSAGVDIADHRWGFSARGRYSSRKILFFLFNEDDRHTSDPESNYIVKMVRNAAHNARLENEYRALAFLNKQDIDGKALFPRAEFFGYHNNLAILGESHIDGVPFRAKTHATVDCPYAKDVVDWLIQLGAATACRSHAMPEEVADALRQLLQRFVEIYCPSPEIHTFLADQIAAIGRFPTSFPLVFQHGDPGTWNIFVTNNGRVAFLDWEAAETQGMPLWDLYYFLRSYCTWAARRNDGVRDTLAGFEAQFLGDGPFGQAVIAVTERYCQRVGLPREMVEPLFYTCWMHRALKQATSLPTNKLASGHYVNLLRLTIEERENSPTLRRLFSCSESTESS